MTVLVNDLQEYQDMTSSSLSLSGIDQNIMKGIKGRIENTINKQRLFKTKELVAAIEEIKTRYDDVLEQNLPPDELKALQDIMKDSTKFWTSL